MVIRMRSVPITVCSSHQVRHQTDTPIASKARHDLVCTFTKKNATIYVWDALKIRQLLQTPSLQMKKEKCLKCHAQCVGGRLGQY